MFSSSLHSLLLTLSIFLLHTNSVQGETCIVPSGALSGDDSPAVLAAFQQCGQNGKIVFGDNMTYNIGKIMNTTSLLNCEIDLKGKLLVRLCF